MTRLTVDQLAFARAHITHFYDSDFYPKSWEYSALWASWPDCLDYLTGTDISNIPANIARIDAAPKPGGDFRVVHQLDPVATLVYTGMVRGLAPHIEAKRRPVSEGVACSYRIQLDENDGGFFGENIGYQQFLNRCRELAADYSHVLVADIADFYNQVYLHRLQNALRLCHEDAGPLSTAIEEYLIGANGGVSKGIPVGPAASIIMAEACLIDVDEMILSNDVAMTRYVDDIRVFANSPHQLSKVLEQLTVYLYSHHRLSLASAKTRVLPAGDFLERYIDDPALIEAEVAHQQLRGDADLEDTEEVSFPTTSVSTDGPPDPAVITELMDVICGRPKLNLGLARHLLRKCRKYRIRAPITQLLDNFSFFAPVITEVVLYLRKVSNQAFLSRHRNRMAGLYESEPALRIPFVRHWFDGYVASYPHLLDDPVLRRAVRSSPSFAAQAIYAQTSRDVAWVRSQKQDLTALSPSHRREVFRASLVLAVEERRNWLRQIRRNYPYLVDRAVIDWAISQ